MLRMVEGGLTRALSPEKGRRCFVGRRMSPLCVCVCVSHHAVSAGVSTRAAGSAEAWLALEWNGRDDNKLTWSGELEASSWRRASAQHHDRTIVIVTLTLSITEKPVRPRMFAVRCVSFISLLRWWVMLDTTHICSFRTLSGVC